MAFVDVNHCLRSIMSDPNLAIRYLETRIEPVLVAPLPPRYSYRREFAGFETAALMDW